ERHLSGAHAAVPAPAAHPAAHAAAAAHPPAHAAAAAHPNRPSDYAHLDAARHGHYVHKGAKGDEVVALQRALVHAGIGVTVDGDFGPKTEAAVREFQAAHRCKVDGVVGPETMAALDKALDHPAPAPN